MGGLGFFWGPMALSTLLGWVAVVGLGITAIILMFRVMKKKIH